MGETGPLQTSVTLDFLPVAMNIGTAGKINVSCYDLHAVALSYGADVCEAGALAAYHFAVAMLVFGRIA